MSEALLGNVMVDCGDAEELQRFYGELLGCQTECFLSHVVAYTFHFDEYASRSNGSNETFG